MSLPIRVDKMTRWNTNFIQILTSIFSLCLFCWKLSDRSLMSVQNHTENEKNILLECGAWAWAVKRRCVHRWVWIVSNCWAASASALLISDWSMSQPLKTQRSASLLRLVKSVRELGQCLRANGLLLTTNSQSTQPIAYKVRFFNEVFLWTNHFLSDVVTLCWQ